jgi:predicted alpha-1,6-mannanase (GH76 family)
VTDCFCLFKRSRRAAAHGAALCCIGGSDGEHRICDLADSSIVASGMNWRSPFLVGFLALSICFGLSCNGQTAATYHSHADLALQSFLLKFWNGGQQYLRDSYPDDGKLTGYWTYAHGWEAVMDGVERTGAQQYSGLIESFYLGQDAHGWFSAYYDDECWMILALTHAYDLTDDPKYLSQAENLYADVMNAWDTTCCGSVKGGVWWDRAHTQKATASNAGAALAGARLYQRSGNSTYLAFAEQVYSYWFTNMVDPVTHQVADHFQTDGTKVWWRFTYNEGLMIGASVELNLATSNATYFANANSIAHFMTLNETASTRYGHVLYDGPNTGCGGDCHEFKGPAYRYLMRLYAQNTSRTDYYLLLKGSVDAMWNLALNTTSTVFSVDWAGPVQPGADEPQDNAACIALSRFAQQFGPYPGSGIPANQYEAENATLHYLGLEANYPGFTGWAYIASWNGDGQAVDFRVNCPQAGAYTLAFHYAAGAGSASRLISINGTNVFPNQPFANTGSWSSYNTLTLNANLLAGTNIISMAFKSSLGSANYLNLDNLVVTPVLPEQIRFISTTLSPGGNVQLTWTTVAGHTYQVQSTVGNLSGSWTNLGSAIVASGSSASILDNPGQDRQRFYRVVR